MIYQNGDMSGRVLGKKSFRVRPHNSAELIHDETSYTWSISVKLKGLLFVLVWWVNFDKFFTFVYNYNHFTENLCRRG